MGAWGFFSAMYIRIARFSRSASASPATAMTCFVRASPLTAIATPNARIASVLLCWLIPQPP